MSLKQLMDEDQRLVILRACIDAGGDANESILQAVLDTYGHRISRDLVRNHILWLEEQGTVTVERPGGYFVVSITGRGQDVAEGRATIQGIKRPRARG